MKLGMAIFFQDHFNLHITLWKHWLIINTMNIERIIATIVIVCIVYYFLPKDKNDDDDDDDDGLYDEDDIGWPQGEIDLPC